MRVLKYMHTPQNEEKNDLYKEQQPTKKRGRYAKKNFRFYSSKIDISIFKIFVKALFFA